MGVLDFAQETNTRTATSNRQVATNNRPKAKLWLNIGYEQNGKFVNLPVGIPLDTMEPVAAKGQNVDWVAFQSARNELLKALQTAGDKMEPGAEMVIPSLEIRVRHVSDELSVESSDNEYAVDLASMFESNTKIVPAE